jgi:hypothetical protein
VYGESSILAQFTSVVRISKLDRLRGEGHVDKLGRKKYIYE